MPRRVHVRIDRIVVEGGAASGSTEGMVAALNTALTGALASSAPEAVEPATRRVAEAVDAASRRRGRMGGREERDP